MRRASLALVVAVVACGAACGTSAGGVQSCKDIEEARCGRAPSCGLSLEPPHHTAGSDVDACDRFYDVACLHGLSVADPGAPAVTACVDAIQRGACTVVVTPALDPACAWLEPDASAPGSPDATAVDAASDGP